MNNKLILGIVTAAMLLTVLTAPAMAGPNTMYFVPSSISVGPNETTYVEVWFNLTDVYGVDPLYGFSILGVNITWDPNVVDILSCDRMSPDPWDAGWGQNKWGDSWYMILEFNPFNSGPPYGLDPGVYPCANFTSMCQLYRQGHKSRCDEFGIQP
jgi:hypothetical protein